MNKQNKNSIENPNPSKADFDSFYSKPNPWNFDGSFNDLVRQEILKVIFKNKRYKNGVDIACGEGFMTARLNFIENKVGIDISETAIKRANKNFPHIKFLSGNAFTETLINDEFEFVSCFEALYYPSTKEERIQALEYVKGYGSNQATYAFSVVTIGENKHRKYFTKKDFLNLLSETGYSVISENGFVVRGDNILIRIIRKFIEKFLPKKISIWLWAKIVMLAPDKLIYQHIFICQK